jgi:hypothetical protein
MNYPGWAWVAMVSAKFLCKRIAGYLDDEALSFVDCQPGNGLTDRSGVEFKDGCGHCPPYLLL